MNYHIKRLFLYDCCFIFTVIGLAISSCRTGHNHAVNNIVGKYAVVHNTKQMLYSNLELFEDSTFILNEYDNGVVVSTGEWLINGDSIVLKCYKPAFTTFGEYIRSILCLPRIQLSENRKISYSIHDNNGFIKLFNGNTILSKVGVLRNLTSGASIRWGNVQKWISNLYNCVDHNDTIELSALLTHQADLGINFENHEMDGNRIILDQLIEYAVTTFHPEILEFMCNRQYINPNDADLYINMAEDAINNQNQNDSMSNFKDSRIGQTFMLLNASSG